MGIKETVDKWLEKHPALHKLIYGNPIVIETAPLLARLYEEAAPTGKPIIVTTKDEYWMVMCDVEFLSYVKDVPHVDRIIDEQGREFLGNFRGVEVWSTYIDDGSGVDGAIDRIKTALHLNG